MSVSLIISLEAEKDIEAARAWYERQRPGLGNEFLLSVEEACNRIAWMPLMYADVYRGLRQCILRRFSYVLYYRAHSDRKTVAAVVHSSRHHRRWQSRT